MANEYHYVDSGLDYIWLTGGFEMHKDAYGEAVSIKDLPGLHQLIAMHLIDNPVPLTGDEIRFLRIELDLSQKALGEALGRTEQTVSLWERGQSVPRDVDFLIRHIYRQSLSPESTYIDEVKRLQSLDREGHRDRVAFSSDGHWAITQ